MKEALTEKIGNFVVRSEKWTLERESEHFCIYNIYIFMDDFSDSFDFPAFVRVVSKITGVCKNFKSYKSASNYVNIFEEGFSYGRK